MGHINYRRKNRQRSYKQWVSTTEFWGLLRGCKSNRKIRRSEEKRFRAMFRRGFDVVPADRKLYFKRIMIID